MEVEAVDQGTLGKILVQAGTEGVKVNQPIAMLLGEGEGEGEGEDASAAAETPTEPKPEAKPAPKQEAGEVPASATGYGDQRPKDTAVRGGAPKGGNGQAGPVEASPAGAEGERVFASPLARRMAQQAGLDLTELKGTGPHGRIVKADIEAALSKKPEAAPARP